ncbi:copper homeostasis protein cutC homolog [Contarinia nasturtii]|uniref:copper homeostasis protein cutC homolog n=1 Tax=Contarinia nasturtii TaxID=265458 RepID=UPI0012D47244|nr:copper homeostasis protein cutC homolog [Contarinia nasturtii]
MLEVCVDSFESVKAAVEGGANRIELCSALSEGGLTPSVGLLKIVKSHFPETKVFAMLRPHGKISYDYTDTDMEIIIKDMNALIENKVDGFVFGALTADRHIDIKKCGQIFEYASGLPVTFHRAFDMAVPEFKYEHLSMIAACGFDRLLTSGFAETAELGLDELIDIKKYIDEKQYNLIVMPGCGITISNAEKILQTTGCKEFHASAKTKIVENIPSHSTDTSAIKREIQNNSYAATNCEIVRQLVAIGKKYL